MANEILTDNLNPPICDQRPGRGRIKSRHQDVTVENNSRPSTPATEGRCELIEENMVLLDARLDAVEQHLAALHVARMKGAV
jgi:hypothetical protein